MVDQVFDMDMLVTQAEVLESCKKCEKDSPKTKIPNSLKVYLPKIIPTLTRIETDSQVNFLKVFGYV